MKKLSACVAAGALSAALCISSLANAQAGPEGREQLVVKNSAATLAFDLAGGALSDFHFNSTGLNPFTWNWPKNGETAPQSLGHFICFDRWGQPSAAELKNGMPFHGEATAVNWQVTAKPSKRGEKTVAGMKCDLPIGGLRLEREITLHNNLAVLDIKETITNNNALGRVYNIVQHPSIAAPFLDESVVVNSNAWKGYLQESPWPNPEEPVIYWPEIAYKGKFVDLGRLSEDHNPGVTSFVFKEGETTGWVSAMNPDKRLLVGYIWSLEEYPWLNIWRNVKDGRPAARGLEFGTTGLHQPFNKMIEKQTIFGKPLYEYIDANEKIVKSYTAFLVELPDDFRGVESIERSKSRIVIKEKRETEPRVITIGL